MTLSLRPGLYVLHVHAFADTEARVFLGARSARLRVPYQAHSQVRVLIRANAAGTVGVGITGPDIETLEEDPQEGAVIGGEGAAATGAATGGASTTGGGFRGGRRRRDGRAPTVGRRRPASGSGSAGASASGGAGTGASAGAARPEGPAVARARAAVPAPAVPGQGFRAVVWAAGRCRAGVVAPRSWVERRRAAPPPGRVLPRHLPASRSSTT